MAVSRAVTAFPAEDSTVIFDSRYRQNASDRPADFSAHIAAGIRGKLIEYNAINWSQSIYTHNQENCELIFETSVPIDVATGPTTGPFVAYAKPYWIAKTFDGNPANSYYQPPQFGSYAYDIEYALNNDLRLYDANTIVVTPTFAGGALSFYFRYSPAKGFVLYLERTDGSVQLSTRILPCSWLDGAHNVHGFGRYNPATNTTRS
jgi:hypothetical protein